MIGKTSFLCTILIFSCLNNALSDEINIEVDEKICQKVQRHLARQDANYKAGVDAHGRRVVPADVSGSQIQLPDTLTIDLSLPIRDLFALDKQPSRNLQNAGVQVGKLEYQISTGKLSFNGQQLAQPALVRIGEKCYEVYPEGE